MMKKAGRKWSRKGIVLVAVSIILGLVAVVFWPRGVRELDRQLKHEYGVDSPEFVQSMGALLGATLVSGNRVTPYQNGDEIFPAMLAAIRGATRSIALESFIYWEGDIGREFTTALSERARAGVPVRVQLDWVGTGKIDDSYLDSMLAAGVEVQRYHKLHWYNLRRMNNRTHRKLLVVDGRIGFTGGVGIADEWLGHAQDPEHWRDSQYRVEGPAVAQMQGAFMDNWLEERAEVLHGERWFPKIDSVGGQLAQVLHSSPHAGAENVRLMYMLSIAAASRYILISNAYFIPDDLAQRTLIEARRRGVVVDIIVPGPVHDSRVTQQASRSRWGPLLEAGVRIHEYQPTMYHNKVMVVDDLWVSVGSTNFDNRSFRLNDEANLNVHDAGLAVHLAGVLRDDIAKSRLVTLEAWQNRPFKEKALDWLSGLLRAQL